MGFTAAIIGVVIALVVIALVVIFFTRRRRVLMSLFREPVGTVGRCQHFRDLGACSACRPAATRQQ